ncbi:MAG: hypothetical protein NPIRA02_05880 [Nitrospirales bacterium]|nr:MAG: hypothetical protein NPIRA02_05880 [Nitrospirales bacterium]
MEKTVRRGGRAAIELGAVVFTGLSHVVFQGLGAKGLFIALAVTSWVTYIGWRVRDNPSLWRQWGFRVDNLKASIFLPTLVFVLAMLGMLWFAISRGRDLWSAHIVILLLLYPIWGVLQQFLVQALGVSNLRTLFPYAGIQWIVLLGASLFSVVHYPHGWLMFATGLLACVFIPSYLRHRNLWVLGVYHGWLGTFFYQWVLNQDPWVAAFGA